MMALLRCNMQGCIEGVVIVQGDDVLGQITGQALSNIHPILLHCGLISSANDRNK